MERPKFKDFVPDCDNVLIINDMFLENPELYNYIQSLDAYLDYIEDKILSEAPDEIRDIMDNKQQEKGCEKCKAFTGEQVGNMYICEHCGTYVP